MYGQILIFSIIALNPYKDKSPFFFKNYPSGQEIRASLACNLIKISPIRRQI